MDTPLGELLADPLNPRHKADVCCHVVSTYALCNDCASARETAKVEEVLGIEVTERTTLGQIVRAFREAEIDERVAALRFEPEGPVIAFF